MVSEGYEVIVLVCHKDLSINKTQLQHYNLVNDVALSMVTMPLHVQS